MADREVVARASANFADRIVFVGHATVLIELDGVRLLTDPLLRSRVAHLRRHAAPVSAAAVGDLDAVLISHLHHDHLDLASMRSLGAQTRVLVPHGAGAWLRRRGFGDVNELAAGERASVAGLSVAAVSAVHDGRRIAGPASDSVGYLVGGSSRSVYFAGDTELFAGMADVASGLDVALVPVAGWGPTLGPGHMDPLQAARAVALLAPRVAIPIHWGTLLPLASSAGQRARLLDPGRRFAEHVADLAPRVEVRVLAPGQETELR
jgi:L-ascorbate metabolism protein UlaG (beta-lactamase superfamily)